MIITSIVQQKRNVENVNIFLDNTYWISLSKSQLVEHGLFKGIEVTDETKLFLEAESQTNKIMEKVLNFISVRPRSEMEVRTYLMQKRSLDKEEVLRVITILKTKKYIDDNYFTNWFVENRLNSSKAHGINKIKAELLKKGIASKIITEVFQTKTTSPEQEELQQQKLLKLVEKYKKTIKAESEYELKSKLIQRLVARGYQYEQSKELVAKSF